MREVKILSLILLASFLLAPMQPLSETYLNDQDIQQTTGRSTGVDLTISDISFSYPSSSDQMKYQMFSSNHPILNFDRPEDLFVVDAVIDVPITIDFTVSNLGTANSGNLNIVITVLHNEYSGFELHNETVTVSSINGGSSTTGQKTITPTYSGNHTIKVYPVASIIDDNPNNDILLNSFTVAYRYFNCDDLSGWTVGNQWSSNSDTSLSQGYACHIGNGQSSTYSSNLNTALITPPLDMSDAVSNPTRTNGISFYYTGSILSGDVMKVYINDNNGNWNEMASVSGTIDQVFTDGANWQTWSVNHAGAFSPVIPAQQQYFTAQTQFKFEFTSDTLNEDIGLWMDDIVIVYDQKVKQNEFGLTTTGVSTSGAVPGSWGKATVEMTNIGNITETFTPSIIGVPTNWNIYYSSTSGVSINPSYGITLQPGETKQFDINFQPDSQATQGLYQVTFKGQSNQYNMIQSQLSMQFQVIPDRIPEITPPASIPSCQPGNTCTFEVEITNIGGAIDVFEIIIDSNELPVGWSVALAWSQPTSILSQPGTPTIILMTYTVPSDALPDSVGKFDLRVTSQNDSSRVDIQEIELTASMISSAEVMMSMQSSQSNWIISPGESKTIYYTIWNNASSQDIFLPSVKVRDQGQWIIEQPNQNNLVINSGKETTFSIEITAPVQSQVGDICPKITAEITSIRSGALFTGEELLELEISRRDDLTISLVDEPILFIPGQNNSVEILVENKGNGPNDAQILVEGLPNDWSWVLYYEGEIVQNPISLTAIYDLDSIKQIQILINPNSTTFAGSKYEYNILVSSFDETVDSNNSDNQINLHATVSTTHNIVIDSRETQIFAGVGNFTVVEATIQNLGNIIENNVLIRAQVSLLDSSIEIEPYFTIGQSGIIFELDKFQSLSLEIGQKYDLEVGFKIPEGTEIGTMIVVKFDIQSTNGSGLEFQSSQTLIETNYRRSMVVDFYSNNIQSIGESEGAFVMLNLTSTSTISENFTINLLMPESWQAVCSGEILGPNGIYLQNAPGYLQEQFTATRCEIYPLNGVDSGEVIITVNNNDDTLIWSNSRIYTFDRNDEQSFSMSSNMIAGSIAGILAIIIITLLVLRVKRTDEEPELKVETPNNNISGPPVSGPPVSSFVANQTQSVIMNPIIQNPVIQSTTSKVPQIPATGLPNGWTMEQWNYYGQRYLDKLNAGGKI